MRLEIPEIETSAQLTSQEYVYARLRNAIMVGAIPTGTSLTMRGVAEQLGLSPTPIREALRRLSSEQAITPQDNRRMLVPEMTAGRFEDLVATRTVLERHAAERALPYVSGVRVQDLRAIDDKMDEAIAAQDYDRLTRLNQDFHRKLYQANPDLVAMPLIESIWLQLGPFHRELIKNVSDFYVVDHHKAILNALDERNAEALVTAIEGDIQDGVVAAGRAKIAAGV